MMNYVSHHRAGAAVSHSFTRIERRQQKQVDRAKRCTGRTSTCSIKAIHFAYADLMTCRMLYDDPLDMPWIDPDWPQINS